MEEQEHILAATKNPKAFKYFYDKYYKSIFLFIYRRTDDEPLSKDITQQVFLSAMQNIKKYQYRGIQFSSWLYRIALNELAQYYRDGKKMRIVCMENKDIADITEDNSINFEKHAFVFKALKALSTDELELIEMRYFEKRSFNEIAEIKNLSENNAKVKVHRILNKIRNSLPVEHIQS